MKPYKLICQYYPENTLGHEVIIRHGQDVTRKAISVAEKIPHLGPDLRFIAEAAMLHDIGIFKTHAPDIHCHGTEPYIRHGVLGAEILIFHGMPRHALVCERHTGTGISVTDIKNRNLPLPSRNMMPESIEEQIICYADKFFSKNPADFGKELPVEKIVQAMKKFGQDKADQFIKWHAAFSGEKHTP